MARASFDFTVHAVRPCSPPLAEVAPGIFIVAHLTLQAGPVLLSGCSLTHSDLNTYRLRLPHRHRDERAVIVCPMTRVHALGKAVNAYNDAIKSPAVLPVATAPQLTELST
jgi:hypothetical protein